MALDNFNKDLKDQNEKLNRQMRMMENNQDADEIRNKKRYDNLKSDQMFIKNYLDREDKQSNSIIRLLEDQDTRIKKLEVQHAIFEHRFRDHRP